MARARASKLIYNNKRAIEGNLGTKPGRSGGRFTYSSIPANLKPKVKERLKRKGKGRRPLEEEVEAMDRMEHQEVNEHSPGTDMMEQQEVNENSQGTIITAL